jgi:hypothetical protein
MLGYEKEAMMMKKLLGILSLGLFLLIPLAVHTESLKGGYPACLTQDLFDQYIAAAVKKDVRAIKYLHKNGCIIAKKGIPVSVLDTSWTGTAKVRAYLGDKAVILWTNVENIQR